MLLRVDGKAMKVTVSTNTLLTKSIYYLFLLCTSLGAPTSNTSANILCKILLVSLTWEITEPVFLVRPTYVCDVLDISAVSDGGDHDKPSKKDLLGRRKEKKEKKDRGYAALEGESSPEEDTDTK